MKCSLDISNFLEETPSLFCSIFSSYFFALITEEGFFISEMLLNHKKTQRFLASGEEFNPGPVMRLGPSELLYNKVLLKYKRDRENF